MDHIEFDIEKRRLLLVPLFEQTPLRHAKPRDPSARFRAATVFPRCARGEKSRRRKVGDLAGGEVNARAPPRTG